MKLFALGTLCASVGFLVYGAWVSSVALVVVGTLALVVGVLAATVVDLIDSRGDHE